MNKNSCIPVMFWILMMGIIGVTYFTPQCTLNFLFTPLLSATGFWATQSYRSIPNPSVQDLKAEVQTDDPSQEQREDCLYVDAAMVAMVPLEGYCYDWEAKTFFSTDHKLSKKIWVRNHICDEIWLYTYQEFHHHPVHIQVQTCDDQVLGTILYFFPHDDTECEPEELEPQSTGIHDGEAQTSPLEQNQIRVERYGVNYLEKRIILTSQFEIIQAEEFLNQKRTQVDVFFMDSTLKGCVKERILYDKGTLLTTTSYQADSSAASVHKVVLDSNGNRILEAVIPLKEYENDLPDTCPFYKEMHP